MKRYKTVDAYVDSLDQWHDEIVKLREILNSTALTEEVKWGMPVYTHDGKNVAGIAAFKEHFGVWFYQGALLEDKENVLINCQEGRTKAMRQWRMTNQKDIKVRLIKAYVKESIANFSAGKENQSRSQKTSCGSQGIGNGLKEK